MRLSFVNRLGVAGRTRVLGYEEWGAWDGFLVARIYKSPNGKYVSVAEWPDDEWWEP